MTFGVINDGRDDEGARDLAFGLIDGLESVRARVKMRLLFWRGTWFTATEDGVPYLQEVFGRQPDERLAARIISDEIRGVTDVTGVRDLTFRLGADRVARYSATVDSIYGEVDMTGEIG